MAFETAAPADRRCAIYTRRSSDQGLDRELNSLEVQRKYCSAYVTSQAHKGWTELDKHYDDGGYSGATLQRPELQRLLADVENGLVDVVVVYKLDRVTRTLLDFVRLTDFFERYGTTFVSITQNFDTSDSMGRLILNVLLTFAQFEREISADRLRDKKRLIRASGGWAGGVTPFGYKLKGKAKRLTVDLEQAKTVKYIFERYEQIGNACAIARECIALGLPSRQMRSHTKGTTRLIMPNGTSINYMVRNPVYAGFLRADGELIKGRHKPIVDKALWDRVQIVADENSKPRRGRKMRPDLLKGLVFDCLGRSMTRHWSCSAKQQFNDYYASLQSAWGRRHGEKTMWVRAAILERLVFASLQELLFNKELVRSGLLRIGCHDARLETLTTETERATLLVERLKPHDRRELVRSLFVRIEVSPDRIQMVVRWREIERFLSWDGVGLYRSNEEDWARALEVHIIDIPFSTTRGRRYLSVGPPTGFTSARKPEATLVSLIREARKAQAAWDCGGVTTVLELGKQIGHKEKYLHRLLRLNYLAPDIVWAILHGTQPADLTRRKLVHEDLPLDWALQRRLLGFAPASDYKYSLDRGAIDGAASRRIVREASQRSRASTCLTSATSSQLRSCSNST